MTPGERIPAALHLKDLEVLLLLPRYVILNKSIFIWRSLKNVSRYSGT
jgi:hypothetical protein